MCWTDDINRRAIPTARLTRVTSMANSPSRDNAGAIDFLDDEQFGSGARQNCVNRADCVDRCVRKSTLIALIGRQFSSAADAETAPSVMWFATIQCIESKQDLAGLAPKDCFISAESVERVAG